VVEGSCGSGIGGIVEGEGVVVGIALEAVEEVLPVV